MTTSNVFNSVDMEHLGGGVCLFRNAVSFDWDWAFNTAQRLVDEDMEGMYTPTIHPETGKPALMNKSGYIFSDENFRSMPGRCSTAHRRNEQDLAEFLHFLEQSKDRYLLQYFAKFPLAYKNVWWKVKGHIVKYGEQHRQYLGTHSDTSADYVYGFPHPSDQLATRNSVSCIVYLNDCSDGLSQIPVNSFSGGHHHFDFLEITYVPRKGDILMFPANYIASHEVKQVTRGERYSYLGWYSHGSPNQEFNEAIIDPTKDPELAKIGTNLYMPNLRSDFRTYLEEHGFDRNSHAYSLVKDGF